MIEESGNSFLHVLATSATLLNVGVSVDIPIRSGLLILTRVTSWSVVRIDSQFISKTFTEYPFLSITAPMYSNPRGGEVDSVLMREPEMLSTMEAGEISRTLKVIS
jgi:hypothetical protein